MIAGVLFMFWGGRGEGLSVLLVWTRTPASTDVAQSVLTRRRMPSLTFQAFGFSDSFRLDLGWVGQGAF